MAHATLKYAGILAAFGAAAGCSKLGGTASLAAEAPQQWHLVRRFCSDCHNAADFAGKLDFAQIGPNGVGAHAEQMEKAVRKLRGHLMPPPKEPQPPEKARMAFVSWLESSLDAAAANNHAFPAIVPHRLNRREYANAIRDILALDVDPTEFLPQDEEVEHFDNIANGLQVSPSFIEQYVIAARALAVRAVGQPNARPGSTTYNAGPGTQLTHVAGLPLGTRGGMVVEHQFPADGEYQINIADMATHIWGNYMEFRNPVVVTLDGKPVYQTSVGGEDDMRAYDQIQDGVMEKINSRLKNIRFHATAGPHKVGVTFRRRTFAESDDQFQLFVAGGGQDRQYRVSSFELSGPYKPGGVGSTPSRDRIFTCHPDRGDDQQLCAERIITTIATRAYRRPIAEADLADLLQYYRDGLTNGGFEEGIRSAITGILASPYFLYRVEPKPDGVAPGAIYRIDDLTLASKLSFFLWSTIPDDELREVATRGELHDPSVLRREVGRMLKDPRAETLATSFVYHWLNLRRLDDIDPDRSIFPYASGNADPREDYLKELELFAQSIFDDDSSVVDLLTAKHTYLNERVALLYGIHDVKGDRFRRVELQDSTRWGLLGKGAILMAAAYPNRTSPVLRGSFILEYLNGTPPTAPPPNVPPFPENDIGTAKARTVRDIMAKHRENPVCFSCHGIMDPLGFALENFDAVGVWRDKDRYAGTAIDSTAALPDGTTVHGPDELREALLRHPDQFVQTFTEALLTYGLGRKLDYRDMPTVRGIVRDAARDDYRFSRIVWDVITSEPFVMRRAPEGSGTVTAQNTAN